MRVISQSGNFDFPYEQIIIHRDENEIWYRLCGDASKRGILANYTSPEKAEKAMELCRGNYSNYFMLRSFNSGLFNSCKSVKELENAVKNMTSASIFQFPADEDVEVENAET